jgi:hypothetical protein
MDRLIEISMSKLFQLAEYVCNKFEAPTVEPVAPPCQPRPQIPTIHFSDLDHMVEGDLFADFK